MHKISGEYACSLYFRTYCIIMLHFLMLLATPQSSNISSESKKKLEAHQTRKLDPSRQNHGSNDFDDWDRKSRRRFRNVQSGFPE